MSLMEHAERELRIAGYSPEDEDLMNREIYYNTLHMVDLFAQIGHSGGSAPVHTDMIARLLQFQPLGAITDDPAEWMDVSDMMGPGPTGVWQCRRDGRMFSEDGGKTYYSVDELRRGWKRKLLGRTGKIYKSEPKR